MTEKQDSISQSSNETRIDLGEDLLEKTAMIPGLPASDAPDSAHAQSPLDIPSGESGSIEDLIHSAKILVDEGLVEDAKKILHQILIIDSGNRAALEAMNSIQKEELKVLFREDITRQRAPHAKIKSQEMDPEELMRKLDQDLGLGIFGQNSPIALASDLSLFQSSKDMETFALKLEKNLAGGKIQDWVDLGIAFLEMDFYQIAVRLFTGACRKIDSEMKGEQSISATSLLALSLILLGRPFEAISKLQPLLRDVEIKADQKVELYYLMGRTYESLKKFDFAIHFYDQVKKIDPRYRDIEYRLRNRKQLAR
jgi:tetratricopeptide (TPR) repeat protein